jgi:GAF domain-containing protein
MKEEPMQLEVSLAQTMVELADTLVDDFDVVELFSLLTDRCVAVLGISAAGLMLISPEGVLRVAASSSEKMRHLELFEEQAEEGPCLDCYRLGEPVVNQDLVITGGRWPRFAPKAVEAGFRTAHALPMRLRRVVIGALNLFGTEPAALADFDIVAAQALADVATIAILQQRAAADAQLLSEQLSLALNTRILIEQAKGMLAERAGLEMDRSFAALREYARRHNRLLADVARDFIAGHLTAPALLLRRQAAVPPPAGAPRRT